MLFRSHYEDVRLYIFSDHGMANCDELLDLKAVIEPLPLRFGVDYAVVYDSTMARFWFFNDKARAAILSCLEGQRCGKILGKEELKSFGVHFEDGRFGESIFLLNPGTLLARSDFNGKGWDPAGMHGYHPADAYSDAIYLTNRKPKYPVHHLQEIYANIHESVFERDPSRQAIPSEVSA